MGSRVGTRVRVKWATSRPTTSRAPNTTTRAGLIEKYREESSSTITGSTMKAAMIRPSVPPSPPGVEPCAYHPSGAGG